MQIGGSHDNLPTLPFGTLLIAPDGSLSGYEPTRQDILNTVHKTRNEEATNHIYR